MRQPRLFVLCLGEFVLEVLAPLRRNLVGFLRRDFAEREQVLEISVSDRRTRFDREIENGVGERRLVALVVPAPPIR